ncbi:endonuclease domain-containing protein [Yonghaparkia sp. Soil809]|uniref:endonuclease domain-containing protein n=1 Tax=Yonghaparkia sp. Soil809 TaxID=1736417 RepID=UPI00138F18A9|nr:DUF559 domain-containing protein [Yonghaparkia sp. Soil809]
MVDIHHAVRHFGGLISTSELETIGVTRGRLAGLVSRRALVRVRRGWFSAPDIAADAVRAARVGGTITCAQSLRAHGYWAVPDGSLHVLVPRNAARLRSAGDARRAYEPGTPGLRVHWMSPGSHRNRLVADPVDAIATLRFCAPRELYLASLESVLHRSPGLRQDLVAAGHRIVPDLVDGTCESGTETLFRLRMHGRLPSLRPQVRIPGVGSVDFLIGERLVIEIDGASFHDTESTFENDRRRDAELSRRGFRVLRFSYRQVMEHWSIVEAAVLAALQRGDHR